MHFFSQIIDNLELFVTNGGYVLLALVSVVESLPFIGSVVPGHTTIVLAGFLSKLGVFNLWYVVSVASIGALIGDAAAYFIGKKYGLNLIKKAGKYFLIQEESIEKAKKVIDTHTGKALILGRFNPVTRSITPFLVGASGAHLKRFWLYDIVGAITWSISSVFIGYIFGASYDVVAEYVGKFAGVGIVIAILIVWAYRFINSRWHIFIKYDLFTLALNLISLYVLFKTIQDSVGVRTFLTEIDIAMNTAINTFIIFYDSALRGVSVSEWVTMLGNVFFVAGACVLAFCWFIYRRQWEKSATIALSFGGVVFWVSLMKIMVMRLRPENALGVFSDPYSFPSFHAAAAAMGTILLIYLWAIYVKSLARREWTIVGIVLLGLVVACTRLYVSVHWFSDVLAGYSLGVFWTTLSVLFVKYVGALTKK